jgi:hypothetical protein
MSHRCGSCQRIEEAQWCSPPAGTSRGSLFGLIAGVVGALECVTTPPVLPAVERLCRRNIGPARSKQWKTRQSLEIDADMGSRSRTIFMVPAVIMIGLCCASCTTNPRAPGWNGDIPVVAAPDPQTETFAETVLQDLREEHDLAMEGELYDRIWPVFASLLAAAQIDPAGWEIYILEAPDTVDIRAVHGRRLFLWSGAADLIESEEELAGLIAVELAHELTQHTVPVAFHPATEILFGVADVATTLGLAALSQGMLAVSMPGMTRHAYIQAADLDPIDRQYTPEQERETAYVALAILDNSAYCADGLRRFWTRIDTNPELRARAKRLLRGMSARERLAIWDQETEYRRGRDRNAAADTNGVARESLL